ncbi:MAG: HWE histidine kinase domain-containing protein [Brevundimonas sp.]|uniref:sensor histidine kinase n=1 Tax=Brevundimonas sp. TaxID=1871086 RepID=UPI00271E0CCE|nr:HWE histidine kinase domain-containing protein [Brevundimonas sp.]MDO9607452.1 HWE histidine kinase domain-containing protein [Brevundimonas sp.]
MTTTPEQLKPLLWEKRNLVRAVEAAGVTLWSWNVDTDALAMDDHAYDLWGIPRGTDVRFEDLSARIHPADRNRVRAAFTATRAIIGAYEIDFRILIGDDVKWISARGQGDDAGMVERLMFGIFIDVTGRKQAEEGRELLAGEMSHRVKNLLAIATGLTAITSRSTNTVDDMARELTLRLTALGRAHDLVRPVPGQTEAPSALLGDLLTVLLAPYDDLAAFSGRIRVSVPRMSVGEAATTIVALIVHELATNSLKYGALSVETGMLDVSCSAYDEAVTIVWTESGGPKVPGPMELAGYGSKLIERSVNGHLRGSIHYDWAEEGIIVTLRVDPIRLAA